MKTIGWLALCTAATAGFAACSSDDTNTNTTLPTNPDASTSVEDAGSMPDAGVDDGPCKSNFSAADACGGNLVGVWTYSLACTNQNFFSAVTDACPGAMIRNQVVTSSGTLTLNLNLSFQRQINTVVTGTVSVPAECAVGGCDTLANAVTGMLDNATVTCVGASSCECEVAIQVGTNDVGDFTFVGNTVSTGPRRDPWLYCVEDDTLTYRGLDPNPDRNVTYYLNR